MIGFSITYSPDSYQQTSISENKTYCFGFLFVFLWNTLTVINWDAIYPWHWVLTLFENILNSMSLSPSKSECDRFEFILEQTPIYLSKADSNCYQLVEFATRGILQKTQLCHWTIYLLSVYCYITLTPHIKEWKILRLSNPISHSFIDIRFAVNELKCGFISSIKYFDICILELM